MATNKLDRIERDIEKTKTKIAEPQKQLRELEAAKTEQENFPEANGDGLQIGMAGRNAKGATA